MNVAHVHDERPATLEMVAKHARGSPSTVSRILNGTATVSEEKKKAVESAIAALNFSPNPVAQGLSRGKSRTIGIITQAIDSPFYGEGLKGIESTLADAGYAPLFVSGHWRPSDEQACLAQLIARRVDGVIVLTGSMPDKVLAKQAKSLPLVVTGRTMSAPGLHAMAFDNHEGARLATRHLLELGHQKIACITGPSDHSDAVDRLRGCQAEMKAAGLSLPKELIVEGDFLESGGVLAVQKLLASRASFTGILALNDQSAYGAALALYRSGLRVPDDISLVGFDDLRSSSFTIPPLTTVRHAIYEIGQQAAMAVVDLVEGRKPTQRVPVPELVVRESTRRLRR